MQRVPLAAAIVIGGLAVAVTIVRPPGRADAGAAAVAEAEATARPGTAMALASEAFGDGRIVLVGFEDRARGRFLGLGYAVDRGRGWRITTWTARRSDLQDVKVGSLLLASASGAPGRPAWTAAYGELADERIARVQISWAQGEPSTGERRGSAYLIVRRGEQIATEVRYLAADGAEIALIRPGS